MFYKYLKLILFSTVLLQASPKLYQWYGDEMEALQKDCKVYQKISSLPMKIKNKCKVYNSKVNRAFKYGHKLDPYVDSDNISYDKAEKYNAMLHVLEEKKEGILSLIHVEIRKARKQNNTKYFSQLILGNELKLRSLDYEFMKEHNKQFSNHPKYIAYERDLITQEIIRLKKEQEATQLKNEQVIVELKSKQGEINLKNKQEIINLTKELKKAKAIKINKQPTQSSSKHIEGKKYKPRKILNYKIISKKMLKKGGQLNPATPPKYDVIRTYAALQKDEELTKENVKAVLKKIISGIQVLDNPDGIVVFLHQSEKHIEASIPFARAEWWPKGHSFSPKNVINIENKSTHVTTYKIDLPEKVDQEKVVTRLSEQKRKEIFAEIVQSEDRANKEAEKKYPWDASKIPMHKLKHYNFKSAMFNYSKESKQLQNKYKKEILKKYQITEDELQKISMEAIVEKWPLPRY